MTVVFRDALLRRAAEEPGFCPPEWSLEAVKTFRQRLQRLDAVHTAEDLIHVRSIGVQRGAGGALSIHLDERVVLALRVDPQADGLPLSVVLEGFVVLRKEMSA